MAQVGDMVSPTNLAREFDLPLKFLVPPSIIISLVIILILLHIPTQFVLSSLLTNPSGLLVTLLGGRMHRKYILRLGGSG